LRFDENNCIFLRRCRNMKWITREKAKVDRIACPWLIERFVDKEAKFIFVPKEKVIEMAARKEQFRLMHLAWN
jgi:hypothetical protein